MSAFDDFMRRQNEANARFGYTQALDDPTSPEAMAEKIRAALQQGGLPEDASAISDEEIKQAKANLTDWAQLSHNSPILTQRMGNPALANLFKDDVTRAGLAEELAWKLGKDNEGEKGTLGGAAARGLWNRVGADSARGLATRQREHQFFLDLEKRYNEGALDSLFGVPGTTEFEKVKTEYGKWIKDVRTITEERIDAEGKGIQVGTTNSSLYPASDAMRKLSESDGFGEAVSNFFESPLDIIRDAGVESTFMMGDQLLMSAALGLVPGLGPTAAMGATGMASFLTDYGAGLSESLMKAVGGDASKIPAWVKDPRNFDAFNQLDSKAKAHATATAGFDALSFGLASKTPVAAMVEAVSKYSAKRAGKAVAKDITKHGFGVKLADLAAQTQIQGFLGGAGEAAGQLLAEGQVTSWGDVVAEWAGEHTYAPLEVAAASTKHAHLVQEAIRKAQENKAKLNNVVQTTAASKTFQRSPEVMAQLLNGTGSKVTLHVDALNQEQVVQLKQALPEQAEEIDKARASGQSVELPVGDAVVKVAPAIGSDTLVEHSTPDDGMTEAEAITNAAEAKEQTAQAFSYLEQTERATSAAYKAELAEVRGVIQNAIREAFTSTKYDAERGEKMQNSMDREEVAAVTALWSTIVSNIALDTGMSPMDVWNQYGVRTMAGNKDLTRKSASVVEAKTERGKEVLKEMGANPTEQTTAEANTPEALNQEQKGKSMPTGSYDLSSRTLLRWANADKSTFLHETGHAFLHMRSLLAANLKAEQAKGTVLTEAQKHFIESTEKTVKWLGAESLEEWVARSQDQQREGHEKFARTFESYLRSGEAPTKSLQSLFRTFSRWLRSIYVMVSGVPGSAQLNPEVQELFDTLFSSYSDLEEAKMRRGWYLARNADGMSPEQITAYDQARGEQLDKALEELVANRTKRLKMLRDFRDRNESKMLKDMRDRKASLVRQATEAFNNSRVGKALAFFNNPEVQVIEKAYIDEEGNEHKAKTKSIRHRLSIADLKGRGFSAEQIASLKHNGLASSHSAHDTDALAERLGYASGDELVNDLLVNPNAKSRLQNQIKDTINQQFNEREFILRAHEADDALINSAAVEVAANQLAVLEKAMTGAGLTQDARTLCKALAEQEVEGMLKKDLNPSKLQNAIWRASHHIMQAVREGNAPNASRFARQRLFLEMKALIAKEENVKCDKIITGWYKLRNKSKLDGVETAYFIQIQKILEALGLELGRGLNTKGTPQNLADFINEHNSRAEQDGSAPIHVSPEISNIAMGVDKRTIADLTVGEIHALADLIQDLRHRGADVGLVNINGQKMLQSEVDNAIANSLTEGAESQGIKREPKRETTDPHKLRGRSLKKMFTTHLRIPHLLRSMEGKKWGVLYDWIVKPGDQAAANEAQLKSQYATELDKIFSKLLDGLKRNWKGMEQTVAVKIGNRSFSITKQQALTMLCNMGNEENAARLVEGLSVDEAINPKDANGEQHQFTEEDVLTIVGTVLTSEEVSQVQALWDCVGRLWPKLAQLEMKQTGRMPNEVQARPLTITMADGKSVSLKGGYYPIKYDREASRVAGVKVKEEELRGHLAGLSGNSRTKHNWSKARAEQGLGKPLVLTLSAGFDGIQEQIHDLCWREWVITANKIFKGKDSKTTQAILDYWGTEYLSEIENWIEDVRTGGVQEERGAARIFTFLRSNISIACLGYSFITAAIQPVALIQSAAVIGTGWLARGAKVCLSDPKGRYQYMISHSNEMANRSRTRFRELAEVSSLALGSQSTLKSMYQRGAYWMIIQCQLLADMPTWYGALEKARAEGLSEEEAIARADREVKDAQGSGDVFELSGIERGNAAEKLMTVFYTFFNATMNAAYLSKHTESTARFILSSLMIFVLQPVTEQILREAIKEAGSNDDDPDKWGKLAMKSTQSVLNFNLGMFVGVREVASFFDTPIGYAFGYKESPMGYSGPTGFKLLYDLTKLSNRFPKYLEGEIDARGVSVMVDVISDFTGAPAAVIRKALTGAEAMSNGDANPFALITGASKK